MDIDLFLKSLSASELKELKKRLINYKEDRATTKELISKIPMSGRLINILTENSGKDGIFEFIDQINRSQFVRLRKAGDRSWYELQGAIEEFKNLR